MKTEKVECALKIKRMAVRFLMQGILKRDLGILEILSRNKHSEIERKF